MTKVIALVLLAAMIAHIIKPLGLPGLKKRARLLEDRRFRLYRDDGRCRAADVKPGSSLFRGARCLIALVAVGFIVFQDGMGKKLGP